MFVNTVPKLPCIGADEHPVAWNMPTEGISLGRHRTETMLSSVKVHAWMVSVGNAAHQPQ
jgi:hypothetical protein